MVMCAMGEDHICALNDIDQKYDKGVRLEKSVNKNSHCKSKAAHEKCLQRANQGENFNLKI